MGRFLLSAGLAIVIWMALVVIAVWNVAIELTTAPLFAKQRGSYYICLVAWGMGLVIIMALLYLLAALAGG